ncbi:MAG: hypothetical protein ACI9VI_001089, partial [Candidatus Azotimanducaceae bacterium]
LATNEAAMCKQCVNERLNVEYVTFRG